MSRAVALVAAVALAMFGVIKGTWAVGGSDSSCYALSAVAFAEGHLQPSSPLALQAPWPGAARSMAPAGFIPSPVRPDAASPVCAPGMSVLMAPLVAMGGRRALFLLTPFAAACLVWCAGLIATRLAGGMAGAVTAVIVATSPIVLFQAVQPMNDILTAALWTAAVAAAIGASPWRAWHCGALMGMAVLVRPNLAPVALVIAGGLILASAARRRTLVHLVAAMAPGLALLLWLNHALYGGVTASGYGGARDLFSTSHLGENLAHYGRAWYETQTAFPLLALAAPFLLAPAFRPAAWTTLATVAAVVAAYALYRPYPEWWYLRFLLPAVVMATALATAVAVRAATMARMGGAVAIGCVLLALAGLRSAAERQVFELDRLEGRYADTGAAIRDRLPASAVVITVWQSGSVRFHAGREAVLWDAIDPDWLDRSVAWLTAQGRPPYLLIERREEPAFRARFAGHSGLGDLDWPPRLDIGREVRLFDPADRARFQAGETYPTENIRRRR